MTPTESQRQSVKKYKRANIKRYQIELNRKTEKDIIERLDAAKEEGGYTSYIKKLVRADLEAEKG